MLRSDPAADSTLTAAPAAIRLWFSAPIQVSVTTVRMKDQAGNLVEMDRARLGEGRDAPIIADVKGRLLPGRASVNWRTMSRDGHVVSGSFAFTLAPTPANSH